MVSIKRISIGFVACLASLGILFFVPVFTARAQGDVAYRELTPEQREAIVQNCGDIKQSLSKLQHSDSRTRTYLGTAYESINSRFITPLNLRLVRNGIPSTGLFEIQGKFASAQASFRDDYVEYMRALEELIAIDCESHPQEFYGKLEIARNRREKLRNTTQKLSELATDQYQSVETLRGTL